MNKLNKINIFYLINNSKVFTINKMIENPKFYSSKHYYNNNILYLRNNIFTGLRGVLSFDTTFKIINFTFKKKLLTLLSAFSSRLLEIKYLYRMKILMVKNSYVYNFLNNLCGFNYNSIVQNIPIKYFINKNKNLYFLHEAIKCFLEANHINYFKIHISKNHLYIYQGYNPNILSQKLTNIILGTNIYLLYQKINIFLQNYEDLLLIYFNKNNLYYVIEFFTNQYKVNYTIPKQYIALKKIIISKKIKFV